MQEIKFRAWDQLENRMAHVEGLAFFRYDIREEADKKPLALCGATITRPTGHMHFQDIADLTIMQFTGLCDNNGKEIYDGDIVKTEWGGIGHVVFNEASFWYLFEDGELEVRLSEPQTRHRAIQVIGNIYENPELIS